MGREEIRIAGAGGQGIVMAGRILAEAAILSGYDAAQSQVYGPQSRGGASRSDVVIESGEVGFPLVDDVDSLVVLSIEAYARYRPAAGKDCCLIVDNRCAETSLVDDASRFPIIDTARGVSGGVLVTGVVALGLLQALTGVVEIGSLRDALVARVPGQHRETNLEALEAGIQLPGRRAA